MSEAWAVEATSAFRRDLHRLPPRIATAIVAFVTENLPENPARLSKPLTGQLSGLRSARRGDYRVVFDLDEAAHVVVLHRVDHRAHVYRPPS